jgi:DNA replication protein DnaC
MFNEPGARGKRYHEAFGDPMTAAAAIDRVVHHSVILELNISSYRLEEARRSGGNKNA